MSETHSHDPASRVEPQPPADSSTLRALFEAIPHAIFVVDGDVRIHDCNRRAAETLGGQLGMRGGEALKCLRHLEAPQGCGTHGLCCECVIRSSVRIACGGGTVTRKFTRMQLCTDGATTNADFLISTSPVGNGRCMLMLENVTELLSLRDLVPICSYCRAIKVNTRQWQRLEEYLHRELQVKLSHGLCPDCLQEHFPQVADNLGTGL